MQCGCNGSCSCTQKTKATPGPTNTLVLQTSESTKVGKNVKTVLVRSDEAVELTLPYQPPAGTSILVATRSASTTVVAGCAPPCACDTEDPDCDTFCDATESVAVPECGQAIFTYFPPDACDSEVKGAWVYVTVAPAVVEPS